MFCLLSPDLDGNDEFVRSRHTYSQKNGKTVYKPPMIESLYSEIASFSHVHHGCFPINLTKYLRTLSQKISCRYLTFPN